MRWEKPAVFPSTLRSVFAKICRRETQRVILIQKNKGFRAAFHLILKGGARGGRGRGGRHILFVSSAFFLDLAA